MKFGVIVFPGSNCDDDMVHVLGTVLGQEVTKIWHKESSLGNLTTDDCIILPGGFSYGDYLRAGAIARFSPVMKAVIKFAHNGGYVWGICNGFQILCEAGLLPGVLLRNQSEKFICQNTWIRVATTNSPITCSLKKEDALKIPIAHADGRYYADDETIKRLTANDQVLFQYCERNGQLSEESNINGSTHHIAGICNDNRKVFGMMPHPERAAEKLLGNCDGLGLFESLLSQVASPSLA